MRGYRPVAGRSLLAEALAALDPSRSAMERCVDITTAGGAALWIFVSTQDDASRVVRLLADYDYLFARYSGDRAHRLGSPTGILPADDRS